MFWRTVFVDLLVFLLCFHFRLYYRFCQEITQKSLIFSCFLFT
nr:MAG TPA: hypothetical protein [Caudoviricetes sp.]